jgi:hypothetical protein
MRDYIVTWSMVYEADNHLDAVAQAYAGICEVAGDPSVGANYVTVAHADDKSIRTTIQIDEALNLLGLNA